MNTTEQPRHMRFRTNDERHRVLAPGAIRAELTEVDGETIPTVTLKMLSYFTVDSYGSLWKPGVLTRGIAKRLPQLAWSHDWSEVIGRALPDTYIDNEIGPQMKFYFDDFNDVPLARRIYSQVKRGTLDECSIGFGWDYISREPTDDERREYPGVKEIMLEAELDEVSIVLRGAVKDAMVVGVRSRSRFLGQRMPMMIDAEEASRIITEVKGGHMDLLSALKQVSEASVSAEDVKIVDPTVEPEKTEEKPVETPEVVEPKVEEPEAQEPEVTAEPETQEDEPKVEEPTAVDEPEEPKAEASQEDEPKEVVDPETPEPVIEPEQPVEPEVVPESTPVFSDSDLAMLADVDSVLAEREAV